MPTESKTINEYVEKFFEAGAEAEKSWELIHVLRDLFGLSYAEAYCYISKYLSKKWEVNQNDD